MRSPRRTDKKGERDGGVPPSRRCTLGRWGAVPSELFELAVAGVRRAVGLLAGAGELSDEVRVVLDVARRRSGRDLLQDVARQLGPGLALAVLPKDGSWCGVNAHVLGSGGA